jgi:hypothetical protein
VEVNPLDKIAAVEEAAAVDEIPEKYLIAEIRLTWGRFTGACAAELVMT